MTTEFLLLMHGATVSPGAPRLSWPVYLARLRALGVLEGGSAIGGGRSYSKGLWSTVISDQITGYLKVRAENLEAAHELLAGNPVFEAGGTVEIRELPRDDGGE